MNPYTTIKKPLLVLKIALYEENKNRPYRPLTNAFAFGMYNMNFLDVSQLINRPFFFWRCFCFCLFTPALKKCYVFSGGFWLALAFDFDTLLT